MMLHWLDGKGKNLTFDASYIKDDKFVTDYLVNDVRPVFLTDQKAKVKGGEKWAGILPRIKNPSWNGTDEFPIHYEGPPVTLPYTVVIKAAAGFADQHELDLYMSLHTFGIRTDVVMSASPIPNSKKYNVKFKSWESWAFDLYDWDPKKHSTVPNPDYGNIFGWRRRKIS